MKETELRIGNWVTNSIGDVFELTTGAFYLFHLNKEWDVQPIPLTEEWLLKFGFEYDNLYSYEKGKFKWSNYVLKIGKDYFSYCKYVHQLQNLYSALTGEELILNTAQVV